MKQRTLSLTAAEQQMQGAEQLAPGIWVDRQGNIHLNVPELLALVNLPNTAENRELVVAMCRRVIKRQNKKVQVMRQDIVPDA